MVGKIFGYGVIKGRGGCGRVGSGRPFRGCRGSTLPIPPSGRPARSSKSHQARAARSQPAQAVREVSIQLLINDIINEIISEIINAIINRIINEIIH